MMKVYRSSEKTNAPLSGAIEVNGFVFVSGQIHIDFEMKLVGNTMEEKFDATINNVKAILAETGLTLKNIVGVTLYLTDLGELAQLNNVYSKYFQHPLPARTAVGVTSLPIGASLEIDVIAVRP